MQLRGDGSDDGGMRWVSCPQGIIVMETVALHICFQPSLWCSQRTGPRERPEL